MRRRHDKRSPMRASDKWQWRWSGLDRSPMTIWTGPIRSPSVGLRLKRRCSYTLRDWGIIVFRFALGFFFLYKALSDFWFSDLLYIGFFFFFFFFFFGESVVTFVIGWPLGLPWALVGACHGLGSVTIFFFSFLDFSSNFFLGFFFFFVLAWK